MPATDQADYFSKQVVRTRRFFLPEWEQRQRDAAALCLVGGGCEWCAPDFIVDRQTFPYLAFEFVSKGRGSVTLADQTHDLEAGHASRVVSLLEEVIDHALRGGRFGLRAACAALEHALVLCADSRQSATTKIDPAYATYLRCRGHLLRNYPVLSSIEQAARACHVSSAYFTRLFQRYDTETPLACLTRLKLSQAAIKLRQPDALVKAVAAELGYKSAAHFSRAFKAWSGRSPRGG